MLYTFFDVETPNRHNDRICSIGAVVTDRDGNVIERASYLVNPEVSFDDMNMRIHGIAPVDVRTAKTFPELWEDGLDGFFPADGVVAHNARFDLSVLTKTFAAYGMPAPRIDYACTLAMSRRCLDVGGCKLPDVCASLGFPMSGHHQAANDAEACMRVFWTLVERYDQTPEFVMYEPAVERERRRERAPRAFSDKTQAMQWLLSMMDAVVSNGEVSFFEAEVVLDFLAQHDELASDPALSPIVSALQEAVMDGWMEERESAELVGMLQHIVNPAADGGREIDFAGKCFVLTGTFEHGSKSSVAEFIESRGGEMLKSVTKKCDYVVVGGCGSEAYSLGSYGSKVKKALDWQAKGVPIQVIRECELFDD